MSAVTIKERPILFSAPMVRAILDGSKTQTRRIVKRQPGPSCCIEEGYEGESPFVYSQLGGYGPGYEVDETRTPCKCPFGAPGDRLWVREAFRQFDEQGVTPRECSSSGEEEWWSQQYVAYRATPRKGLRVYPDRANVTFLDESTDLSHDSNLHGPWKPSIHMPRWASRIPLEIVSIRVERLNDISEEDAKAEGIEGTWEHQYISQGVNASGKPIARVAFAALWGSINGPGSWDANPWVWVVEFKRVEGGGL
jgi:hypothetical protein